MFFVVSFNRKLFLLLKIHNSKIENELPYYFCKQLTWKEMTNMEWLAIQDKHLGIDYISFSPILFELFVFGIYWYEEINYESSVVQEPGYLDISR